MSPSIQHVSLTLQAEYSCMPQKLFRNSYAKLEQHVHVQLDKNKARRQLHKLTV